MSRLVKLLVTSEAMDYKPDVAIGVGGPDARYSFYLEQGGMFMNVGEITIKEENKIIADLTLGTQSQLKDLMEDMTASSLPEFDDYLIDLGSIGVFYYNSFVPDKLKTYIRGLPTDPVHYVYIHSDNHWIPWELIYDDDEGFFWGEKCIIVRVPLLEFSSKQSKRSVLASSPKTMAKVFNIVGDQVAVHLNTCDPSLLALGLLANNAQTFDCNYENGTWEAMTVSSVKKRAVGVSILHFTCHGRYDPDSGYYLQLHAAHHHPKSYRLNALKVQSHLRLDDALVFVNACTSDVTTLHYGTFKNMGQVFFESGAGTFIGTIAPVPIDEAVQLASVFYEYILAGESVGIALHKAKNKMKLQQNPFYLFYCLYGNAYKRFKPAV